MNPNELSNAYYRDTLKAAEALKRMANAKPAELTQTELDALESLPPNPPRLIELPADFPAYAIADAGFANSEPNHHDAQGRPHFATFGRNLNHGRKFYFLGYFPMVAKSHFEIRYSR